MINAEVFVVLRFPLKNRRIEYCLFRKNCQFLERPMVGEMACFDKVESEIFSIEHHLNKRKIKVILRHIVVLNESELPKYRAFFKDWRRGKKGEYNPIPDAE